MSVVLVFDGGVFVLQYWFDQFQVLGVVFVLDEFIEGLGGQVEVEGVELVGDFLFGVL